MQCEKRKGQLNNLIYKRGDHKGSNEDEINVQKEKKNHRGKDKLNEELVDNMEHLLAWIDFIKD